ncbi:MAG: ABC transporter ATP-binding protein [Myxococcales bacterium]|nr:ABC transporter ATP-binding protein [Myxococcales bacterium]
MIEVTHVRKSFGPITALDGVALRIGRGERVAFVGSNGSGKTTLLRCLLGLIRFEGRITIAGVDVAREPELALRGVAYIPQIAPPIEAPLSEVVRAFAGLRGLSVGAIEDRARAFGLDPAASRNKRFRDLSGGMKQKLLAAMAMATEAPVLVCDEPTANLDGEARAELFRQLDARPGGSVVVLCSHRIEEVTQLVDRVVELSDGRVHRDVPLETLLDALRAFRVEVALKGDAEPAVRFLEARGFTRRQDGRFEARLSQEEKVSVVARILREHERALADIVIAPVDDVAAALQARPQRPPQLRAVS